MWAAVNAFLSNDSNNDVLQSSVRNSENSTKTGTSAQAPKFTTRSSLDGIDRDLIPPEQSSRSPSRDSLEREKRVDEELEKLKRSMYRGNGAK